MKSEKITNLTLNAMSALMKGAGAVPEQQEAEVQASTKLDTFASASNLRFLNAKELEALTGRFQVEVSLVAAFVPVAFRCQEDHTLRKAKQPKIIDCRVEPPPPQRRDPFVFKAEVGPMEELLVLNLDQLDAKGDYVVVHFEKNGRDETAAFVTPDTNPTMPKTGDHLLVLSRKYTDQVVDGHNVVGPWSDPLFATVEPPRDAAGRIARGYAEDMRPPFCQPEKIQVCAAGDPDVPGRRVFFSDGPRAIGPFTDVTIYASVEGQQVEIGKCKSNWDGTFACVCNSPIGGAEGYTMVLEQHGHKLSFDPIRHQPFGTDVAVTSSALIDALYGKLPVHVELSIGPIGLLTAKAILPVCSPVLQAGDTVKLLLQDRDGVDKPAVECRVSRDGSALVEGLIADRDHVRVLVQKQGKGRPWIPLADCQIEASKGALVLSSDVLDLSLGAEAGLKQGQRMRVINHETDKERIFTARRGGALDLRLTDTSRGDVLGFEVEDWVDNKRTWLPVLDWQVDAKVGEAGPVAAHFADTVYVTGKGKQAADRLAAMAQYFGTGAGQEVPVAYRKAFILGADVARRTRGIPAEKFNFQCGDGETLRWFLEGYRQAQLPEAQRPPFDQMFYLDSVKIDQGSTYTDRRRAFERVQPTVHNISGIGREYTQTVQCKHPDKYTLNSNELGITATAVSWGGYS